MLDGGIILMNRDNYIYDITISYNHTKLLNEIKDISLSPYWPDNPRKDSWFKGPKTWLYGTIDTITPEVGNIISSLCKLFDCKDIRPHLHKQLKGSSVPLHADNISKKLRKPFNEPQHQCAVNIQLGNEIGPIEFENIGSVGSYKCALLNTMKKHSVPAFHKDRFFIKFRIMDCTYKNARDRYIKLYKSI